MTRIVSFAKKKKRSYPEQEEQIKFVTWLRKQGYLCHHSPNGGRRTLFEGMLFKRMGTSKGFPDVFVCLQTPLYTSFYVEMKPIKGGKVEPEQAEWLHRLREQGAYAEVANGFEEAKKLFNFYLSTLSLPSSC